MGKFLRDSFRLYRRRSRQDMIFVFFLVFIGDLLRIHYCTPLYTFVLPHLSSPFLRTTPYFPESLLPEYVSAFDARKMEKQSYISLRCGERRHLDGVDAPWEQEAEYAPNLAHPGEILTEASNGASDYGNKFGEPLVAGCSLSLFHSLGGAILFRAISKKTLKTTSFITTL